MTAISCSIPVQANVLHAQPVFYSKDPAINQAESNVEEYRKTLDARHLVFEAGPNGEELHVTFFLRAASYDDYVAIAQVTGGDLKATYRELFRVCIEDWANWRYIDTESGQLRYLQCRHDRRPGELLKLHESVYRMVPDDLRVELGAFAYRISRIDHYRKVRQGAKDEAPAAEQAKN